MQLWHRFRSIAVTLVALTTLGSLAVRAQPVTTERVTGDDGRYSIEMPAGYTATTSPRPDGGTMRQISYLWRSASGQFNAIELAFIDPPAGSTKQIDLWEAQRVLQARYPSSLLAQAQEIQLGQAKGLSFAMTFNAANNQGLHTVACKVYVFDGRLYEMMAVTRAEDRDSPVAVTFMNSLRITR